MKTRRLQIEEKLDVLIHHKRTLDFQWLATHVARVKWPTLEATQWYSDAGEDATSYFTVDGVKRSLACSITATLGKIKDDARRIRDEKQVIDVLVFATPVAVTQIQIHEWQKEVDKEFKHGLHVIPRSEIVAFLEQPKNAWLCRDYLDLSFEDHLDESAIASKARAGAARILGAWKDDYKFERIRPIELGISILRTDLDPKSERVGLTEVCQIVKKGRRVVSQGPPGAGKSITLLQLADSLLQDTNGPIPIVMALTEWASDGKDLASFLAQKLSAEGLTAADIARLLAAGRFVLLLNGWNEISSDAAVIAAERLKGAVRDSAATSFVIATRDRGKVPQLTDVVTLRIEPLTTDQKHEILVRSGVIEQPALMLRIETDLADVTETPFFLAGVIQLAKLGPDIPKSRYGILRALVENAENTPDHREALLNGACRKFHRDYLHQIAFTMLAKGAAAMPERDLLPAVADVSRALREKAWIEGVPDAHAVIESLIDHHLLARTPSAGGDVRFVHHQFQEWFAAEWLYERVAEMAGDEQPDRVFKFQREVLNHAHWHEPLTFLMERLSAGGDQECRLAAQVIRWAMPVDLFLAAELAGLAGERVWPIVRDELAKALRSWHSKNSHHHQLCAIAAMLATGAPDFGDIIWPLLESDNSQARFWIYRAWRPFPLTSLGPDWRRQFEKWDEERKAEFIHEMCWNPNQTHINLATELAKADSSPKVKLACLDLLHDAGAYQTLVKILNDSAFGTWSSEIYEQLLRRLPKRHLGSFVPRLKDALGQMEAFSTRSAILELLRDADDADWLALAKAELDRLLITPCVEFRPLHHFSELPGSEKKPPNATRYLAFWLEAIHSVEPDWATDWLARQLVQGKFWFEPFVDYLTKMPEAVMEKLARVALDASLDLNDAGKRAAALAASGSTVAAGALLKEYLAFTRQTPSSSPTPSYDRGNALEHGLREIPSQRLAEAIIGEARTTTEFASLQKLVAIATRHTLSQLTEDQRGYFRSLALRLYDMAPADLPEKAWFRANMTDLLGSTGNPTDAKIIEKWFVEDRIELAKEVSEWEEKRRAWEAGGSKTRPSTPRPSRHGWSSYQQAFVRLGGSESVEVFLRLLHHREMFGDAASGLIQLARRGESPHDFEHRPKYAEVYEHQRRWESSDKTLAGTIKHYADSIFEATQRFFPEIENPNAGRVRLEVDRAVTALASINDSRARHILLQLSVNKYSQWTVADAFHGLMLRGVVLPGKEVADALEPFIAEHEKDDWNSNDSDWCAVVRCFAVLLFSDNPAMGVERIRRLPPRHLKDYHVRDVLKLLGACRAPEAASLLVELSAVPEIRDRYFYELAEAFSENVNEDTRRGLLNLLEQSCKGELPQGHNIVDLLGKAIARSIQRESTIWNEVKSRCKKAGTALERNVLAKILRAIGTDDAALALCDLVDDAFPVSHDMERLIEGVVESRVPAGDSGSHYLEPRTNSQLMKALVGMALGDTTRRSSASELLAIIAARRVERGSPANEPLHPDIEIVRTNAVPWQLWS